MSSVSPEALSVENQTHPAEFKVIFTMPPPGLTNSTAVMNDCRHFPTLKSSSECPYPGYCAEIIGVLARRLGMMVKPVVLSEEELAQQGNSWDSRLAMLENGTADTLCPPEPRTKSEEGRFDFSLPVQIERGFFAVHRRTNLEVEGMWSVFRPYQSPTWALILATLVLYVLIATLIARMEFKLGRRERFHPADVAWKMLRLQLLQSNGEVPFRSMAGRLLAMSFATLQCCLMLSLYQAWIVYSLARPKPSAPFSELSELLRLMDTDKVRFIKRTDLDSSVFVRNWFLEHVQSSKKHPYPQFQDIFKKHPPLEVEQSHQVLEYLDRGGYVTWIHDFSRLHYSATMYHCDIMMVDDGLPDEQRRLMFRKGSPLLPRVNEAIGQEEFVIRQIMEQYDTYVRHRRGKSCADREEALRRFRPFGLVPMIGLYSVMMVLIMAALVAFAIEYLYRGKNRATTEVFASTPSSPQTNPPI